MRSKTTRNAVIYCRVSSTKQTTRGDGLGSQETRCREYAKYRGYTVATVFTDDLSGSLIDRPGMKAMLAYLRKHRREECVVIIDDISRLARGLEAHLQLRGAIANAGGSLESPSIEFGEDSDSVLVENLLASVSQHQRQKNGEQTVNRMRARVMNGYWPFACPVGYRYEKVNGHGKMLVRDEPLASIVQEALEGYASERFQIQAEVKRFLESRPEFPKSSAGIVLNQEVTRLLTRPVYAGYVEAPRWDVSLRKGHHEPLVNFETYRKIQERLAGHAPVPARKNLSQDFPLRGFVTCADCGTPLTACWTTGCRSRYAYYLCPKHGCPSYRKSVRRELLEGQFENLLRQLQPSENLFCAARAMIKDLWDHRVEASHGRAQSLKATLAQVERKIEQLLDRVTEADVASVIRAYEDRIRKLEEQKAQIVEQIASCGRPVRSFDETVRTALDFLGNPWKLWTSERLEDKRTVLKLAFVERLAYARNEGFRTTNVALPFKALAQMASGEMRFRAHR